MEGVLPSMLNIIQLIHRAYKLNNPMKELIINEDRSS